MLDMAPGYRSDRLRGKIEVSSSPEPYIKETLSALSLKPIKSTTVDDAMQLTMENKGDPFNSL